MLHLESKADCSILTSCSEDEVVKRDRMYRTLTSAHLIRADAELALIILIKVPTVPPVHQVAGKITLD